MGKASPAPQCLNIFVSTDFKYNGYYSSLMSSFDKLMFYQALSGSATRVFGPVTLSSRTKSGSQTPSEPNLRLSK
jgi:hypothetical protein